MKEAKQRLDIALVERGLAISRQRAQAMIMAGRVRMNEQPARKASESVPPDAHLEIIGGDLKYASRAGLKLEGALHDFHISAEGRICLDVGSSNGGFTDCLLQHGAHRVYAVDVNTNQLDWRLQRDERVRAIEKNARFLKFGDIPEPVNLITVDVSFISVVKLLPGLVALPAAGPEFLVLIKPQFELSKNLVGKGGIVRDPELHARAVASVRAAAGHCGLTVRGTAPSCLPGAEGNQEFFLHARLDSIQSSLSDARH